MGQHSLCHGGAALVQVPDISPVLILNWECLGSAVCTPIQGICHGHRAAICSLVCPSLLLPRSKMQP